MDLLAIPDDPLLHVLSYLDYKDLIRACETCKRLNGLCNDDHLWKQLCKSIWLQNSHPPGVTWKQHFIHWFQDYGRYVSCYAPLRRAWDVIEEFLEENRPEPKHQDRGEPFSVLNPGTNEHVLEEVERVVGHALPVDVRCSYRIHNGQIPAPASRHGILGSAANYYVETDRGLHVQNYGTNFLQTVIPANIRGQMPSHPGLFPLTVCPFSQLTFMVVLDEISGLEPGQIVSQANAEDAAFPNYADCFIMAESFQSWFCDYAEKLKNDRWVTKRDEIFRFYKDPDCVATTCSVRVEVATCFMPNVSCIVPLFLSYAYHITMSMPETASPLESCKLLRRHWIITDEEGNEEHVDGPGVVGEFPVLRPGSTFCYVSHTRFRSTYGNMRGSFTMLNLASGAEFEIVCPTFHMRSPPQVTGDDRKQRQEMVKKNN